MGALYLAATRTLDPPTCRPAEPVCSPCALPDDDDSMFLELDFASVKRGVTPPAAPTPPAACTPDAPPPASRTVALLGAADAAPPARPAARRPAARRPAARRPPPDAPPPDAPPPDPPPPAAAAASNADAGMREVVETKRKLGFGAEEPVTAVARHGDSPRGMNSGPDVAQLPSTAEPQRRGGGGLPAWWAREMGVLL